MADGNIKVKMKMSPATAGALYMKCCGLEDENKALKLVLLKISNPIAFFQQEAEKEGAKLNGHAAVELAGDANLLREWAKNALNT